MKGVAEFGFGRFNQADVCFVLVVLTQQRGEGENEAAKVHIAAHERDSYRKCQEGKREKGREVALVQAVFLSRRPYSAFLGTWQIERQSE